MDPSIIQSKDSVRYLDSIRVKDSIAVRIKDSVNIRTKDSTIIIPKSDLEGEVENPCDEVKGLKPFDYRLGSGSHKLRVWSDGKRIRYTSSVDSLISVITSKDTYVSQLRDSLNIKEREHQQEIEKVKKQSVTVVKFKPSVLQVLLYILIGGAVIYILTKFRIIR